MFLFVYSPWKAATNIEGACDWYLWLTEGFMSKANDHSFSFFPFPLPVKNAPTFSYCLAVPGAWYFFSEFGNSWPLSLIRGITPRWGKVVRNCQGGESLWYQAPGTFSYDEKLNVKWIHTESKLNGKWIFPHSFCLTFLYIIHHQIKRIYHIEFSHFVCLLIQNKWSINCISHIN